MYHAHLIFIIFSLLMERTFFVILYSLFIIIGIPVSSVAQNYVLNGIVIDQASNTHLAFVKIGINNNRISAVTDINGMFSIRSDEPFRQLLFTKLGYQPLLIDATDKTSPLVIELISERNPVDSLLIGISDAYHHIDSALHKGKFYQLKRNPESLLSGEVEVGWFSFDLNRFKRYNQFEGLYLGAGGHTNANLSQSVSMGGFAGYGFKDRKTKYGFDVSAWPSKDQHFTIKAGYSYDTRESAGSRFFDERSESLDPSAFRFFYANRMDYEQKVIFSIYSKQRFADFYGAIQRIIINSGYDISNGVKGLLPDQFNVSGIVAGIRLAPSEKFLQIPDKFNSKGFGFPVLWFQVTRGIPGMFKGEFNYNRFEGKIRFGLNYKKLGRSTFQLIGSLLDGEAPYFEYFNGRGSNGNFGLYASGSFVTMHPEEFMNDRSLGLFFTHDFGNIIYHSEFSNPSPVLLFNYGWGKLLKNPSNYFLPIMDMHKGFVEAGIQLNNLLDLKVYGLGIGFFYRMGAYSNATFKENLVFKIAITFPEKN